MRVMLRKDMQMQLFRCLRILAGNRARAARYVGTSAEVLKRYESGALKTVPEKVFYAAIKYIQKKSYGNQDSYRALPIDNGRIEDKEYVSDVLRTYEAVVGSRESARKQLQITQHSFEEMIYKRRRLRLKEADRINAAFENFSFLNGIDISEPDELIVRRISERKARGYGVWMRQRKRASAEDAENQNAAWRKNLTKKLRERYGENWRQSLAEHRLEKMKGRYGENYSRTASIPSSLGLTIEKISGMESNGVLNVLKLIESRSRNPGEIIRETGYKMGSVNRSIGELHSGGFISRHGSRRWETTERGHRLLWVYGELKKVGRI